MIMHEYTTYESNTELFRKEEQRRLEELRAKSKAFVETHEELHAPVIGALYRPLKYSDLLPQSVIVMVVSENHYVSNMYETENGITHPTELPEFRELYILVGEKVWPVPVPVESWYRWFERIKL